jgi:hypothetical protein
LGLKRRKVAVWVLKAILSPTNMVAPSFPQGNFKVLTLERAKKAGTVDSEKQISAEEYRESRQNRINKIADTINLKFLKLVQYANVLPLESCWINGSVRKKRNRFGKKVSGMA